MKHTEHRNSNTQELLAESKASEKSSGASTGRHTPPPPRRQEACGYIKGDIHPET